MYQSIYDYDIPYVKPIRILEQHYKADKLRYELQLSLIDDNEEIYSTSLSSKNVKNDWLVKQFSIKSK